MSLPVRSTVFARNTLAVSHLQGHIVPPCALDILPYAIMHQVSNWQIGCSSITQSSKWRSTSSNPPKNLGFKRGGEADSTPF